MLAGALHFHKSGFALAIFRHHDVHINLGAAVLRVFEVERAHPVDHAHGNRGNLANDRRIGNLARLEQLVHCQTQGDESACDRRSARAAVRLNDVAIDVHCPFAEHSQIACRAQRTPD